MRLYVILGLAWTVSATPAAASAVQQPSNDKKLDCGFRELAYKQAKQLQPWRASHEDVYAALELNKCPPSSPKQEHISRVDSPPRTIPSDAVFVEPRVQRGAGDGSMQDPFGSVEDALAACREGKGKSIVLRNGIHYLNATMKLTAKDSGLSIVAYPGESPWLSGGLLLPSKGLSWKPVQGTKEWVTDLSSLLPPDAEVTGLFSTTTHRRYTLARYPNADVEDWNARGYLHGGEPTVKEWWMPPAGEVPDFTFYDFTTASPGHWPAKQDSTMGPYNTYGTGQGGVCSSVWGEGNSYWCGNASAGGWAFVDKSAAAAGRLNIPTGLTYDKTDTSTKRFASWANPEGAIVHVSHTQGWAWHMFNVSGHDPDAGSISFATGGWQGGRNWQCKDGQGHLTDCEGEGKSLGGGSWYIEGVREELDSPGEFFFNRSTSELFFWPNATEQPPDDLVAPMLKSLIMMEGSPDEPVRGVSVEGIGFRDAKKTYMEQWGVPSGGDWALYRGGAIHLEGTKNVNIANCSFIRLDGNAIMLGGYERNTSVTRNEFAWLGDGAMATWGDTKDYDATDETQPQGSIIEGNVIREIGLYEKQSSGWGQAKASLSTIRGNLMFNMPRAAINFNDNLGGGNLVESNLIFNTCRESGDHGPINSWDRMPFLHKLGVTPAFDSLPTVTTRNLIFANYGGSQAFDNDDGSSWYHTHDNVFYSADGFKMDYGGHDSNFSSNLVVTLPYDGQNCINIGSFVAGHGDVLVNNTCVVTGASNPEAAGRVSHVAQCDPKVVTIKNNRYFTQHGNATMTCGNKDLTLADAQTTRGIELGSTSDAIPEAETILGWARAILGQH